MSDDLIFHIHYSSEYLDQNILIPYMLTKRTLCNNIDYALHVLCCNWLITINETIVENTLNNFIKTDKMINIKKKFLLNNKFFYFNFKFY